MARKGVVAIVGRPNVGKSTLFNRILKTRKAIIDDKPGVTRDRIYGIAEWLTQKFIMIDTGGLQMKDAPFQKEIQAQAQIAIEEADVIIFMMAFVDGVTEDDKFIARLLQRSKKPVVIVTNKYDQKKDDERIYEFMTLGFGEPIKVSSAHGLGVGDLLDKIIHDLPRNDDKSEEGVIHFCILGKPNVGKSSLLNTILGEERAIVSPIAGTTRDSIDVLFKRNKQEYMIIDTAGIRRKSQMFDVIERYSLLRTLVALENSDIALLVLDGSEEWTVQDEKIFAYIEEANKPTIIVVNKWDKIPGKTQYTMNQKVDEIRNKFQYLTYAPIEFVSALENKRVDKLFTKVNQVYQNLHHRVSTSILNDVLLQAQVLHSPPVVRNSQLKISYATQAEGVPPVFVLFVNNDKCAYYTYTRYLENQIRENFGFEGVPLKIIYKNKA